MLQTIFFARFEQCTSTTTTDIPALDGIKAVRDKIFYFNSFVDLEISKSIDDMVQTARMVLPSRFIGNQYSKLPSIGTSFTRGTRVTDSDYSYSAEQPLNTKNLVSGSTSPDDASINYTQTVMDNFVTNLDNINVSTTSFGTAALFQRGDMVTIWVGYLIDDVDNKTTGSDAQFTQLFRGYISNVKADEQVVISCEDFMWYFKQLRLTNKHYDTSLANTKGKIVSYGYNSNDIVDATVNGNVATKHKFQTPSNEYPINTINGMFYDALNNSINDYQLRYGSGIFPLIWKEADQPKTMNGTANPNASNGLKISKPYICLSNNPTYKMGNINVETNATMFAFLDSIKSNFNIQVYMLQQMPSYKWGIANGIPTYVDTGTDTGNHVSQPYDPNYLNIGYGKYVSNAIYTPKTYDFDLNGPKCLVVNNNLTWRRKDDVPAGCYVKSWQMADAIDPEGGTVKTTSGVKVKKVKNHNIFVGDYGGMSFTFFYDNDIQFNDNGVISPESVSKMQAFGLAQLAKLHYTGYYGSITILGLPFVNIGDWIQLNDPLHPERNGKFRIKKVLFRGGLNIGYQQELFLDEIYDSKFDAKGGYNSNN